MSSGPRTNGGSLIGLVGFNPASVVVAARALGPTACVFGFTTESAHTARAVQAQLGKSRVQLFEFPSKNPGIDEVRASTAAALDELTPGSGRLMLDVTGGTKPMSIGAALAVYGRAADAQAVWLNGRGELLDAATGQSVGRGAAITPREVVAWTPGATVASTKWEGSSGKSLGALSAHVEGIGPLAEVLMRLLATPGAHEQLVKRTDQPMPLTPTTGDDGLVRMQLPGVELPEALPASVRREGDALICSREGPLAQGGWLEFYALAVLREHFASVPEARIGFGVHLRRAGPGAPSGDLAQDEVDAVVTVGSRTLIIECKARSSSGGAGADLQKRVAKTRQFFGSHAKVCFFHPTWGESPPQALAAFDPANVHLVGTTTAFRAALDRCLG